MTAILARKDATRDNPTNEERALARLLPHCQVRRHPARSTIIHGDRRTETLYYIIRGSVTVMMEDDDGREMVLAYLNAGEFFGETGIFSPHRSHARVVVRSHCETAEIPYARFTELAMRDPQLLFLVAAQMANRLRNTSRKAVDLAFQDVCGRIRRTLHDLCTHPDAQPHAEGTQLRITRQEIARIVGCSREMAGRVLKELQAGGELRARGKTIVVFDRTTGGSQER